MQVQAPLYVFFVQGSLNFIDRAKARSGLLRRLALRTQIRSRLRQGHARSTALSVGLGIADTLESLRKSGDPIEVTFDTSNAPPSYGDFLNVAMMARFLATSGFDVIFRIRDTGVRRTDWSDLSPPKQEQHLEACFDLASALLSSKATVERSSEIWREEQNALPSPMEHQSVPAYMLSQTLLHILMDMRGWRLPEGFLLSNQDFHPPTALPSGPFVSWHVRRGIWDKARDTTGSGVLTDVRQLHQVFPGHQIMLFSSPAGIDFTLELLAANSSQSFPVIAQPQSGFLEAAPYLLASDFYFQRRGGGLSQFAIYSELPYLILNDHASYYHLRSGDRLVPWATVTQRYVIKRGVGRLSIAGLMRAARSQSVD